MIFHFAEAESNRLYKQNNETGMKLNQSPIFWCFGGAQTLIKLAIYIVSEDWCFFLNQTNKKYFGAENNWTPLIYKVYFEDFKGWCPGWLLNVLFPNFRI